MHYLCLGQRLLAAHKVQVLCSFLGIQLRYVSLAVQYVQIIKF